MAGKFVYGCDIYHGDTVTSFHDLYAAGVEWVAIKATQGESFRDGAFADYAHRARSVGMYVAPYLFIDEDVGGAEQADFFLQDVHAAMDGKDLCASWRGFLCPWIDVEAIKHLGASELTDKVLAIEHVIQAALGRGAVIYADRATISSKIVPARSARWLGGYPLILASWLVDENTPYDGERPTNTPGCPSPFAHLWGWQYAATGSYPGVTGHGLDVDVFCGSRSDLAKYEVK